jgi:para-aminobenzoate synthetase component 2
VILFIDNYDSFTYNLVQLFAAIDGDVKVVRNDELSVAEVVRMQPSGIVLSPGPGTPRDAGITLDVIRACANRIPMLGVCLGHQCIAEAFGGRVVHADRLMHGRVSPVSHDGQGIFRNVPTPFTAMRYHSLLVAPDSVPAAFTVSARTAEGEIMGLRSQNHALEGVQFHPESFLSEHGSVLAGNFLAKARAFNVASLQQGVT